MQNNKETLKEVILVDQDDNAIGTEEKLTAHKEAKLHRAFSVFVFRFSDAHWELLLQQRHQEKYHTGGLWTNTCCSHPNPNEAINEAASRRLQEEMGIITDLHYAGRFHYTAVVGPGLIENEIDHVLIGRISQENFVVNTEEVADYKWIDIRSLKNDLQKNPARYTPWLAEALDLAITKLPDLSDGCA
jgi:diphosphomevalonate decarboxylase